MSEQPNGGWVLIAEYRVPLPLVEETLAGAATFGTEEDDAKTDRASAVLAHCLLQLQDDDLEGFRRGWNALYKADLTAELLVELRQIAIEEASL